MTSEITLAKGCKIHIQYISMQITSNYVRRSKKLHSQEGITQGDPLSMILYGLATIPLIQKLKTILNISQAWYADDFSCRGSFDDVMWWWHKLWEIGPKYGYFPQINKTKLIWNHSQEVSKSEIKKIAGMQVVKGTKFLGGYVGCEKGKIKHASKRISNWTHHIVNLAEIAKKTSTTK